MKNAFLISIFLMAPYHVSGSDGVSKDVVMRYGLFHVNSGDKSTYDFVREVTDIDCNELYKNPELRFGIHLYSISGNTFKVLSKIVFDGGNPNWKKWSRRGEAKNKYHLSSNIKQILQAKSQYFRNTIYINDEYYETLQFDMKNCEGYWTQ